MTATTLSALTRTGDETDKQFLVDLRNRGTLNDLQLRALSRRYEAVKKDGSKEPLAVVLAEFDAGEIQIDPSAAARAKPPTLDDAPQGESPKQAILWLHEKGTLTMDQVRRAARLLDQDTSRSLVAVMEEIGATAALPEGYEPAPETEQDAEPVPFDAEKIAVSEQILAHSIPQIKEMLVEVGGLDDLDCLHFAEAKGKDRSGVKSAIEERALEVMESMGAEDA
ncbi:MAG TPA: hypothetical protein VFI96_01130 [Longimicrobiaceae bacterium]|nr:hypothetical protein [Longimicrobiaceae bacterium]